jgi:hypothetical protein
VIYLTYEELLIIADDNKLIAKEKPLPISEGRIKGNHIAIRRGMPTIRKACVLAEELGHHFTTHGNIVEQTTVSDVKQENRARLWAYNKMIGLQGIADAYKNGCRSLHEIAEYLEVTEEFLIEAIEKYKTKYSPFVEIDNYIIYFEPHIGIFEKI